MARTTPGVTRRRILDEAVHLFATRGYDATSVVKAAKDLHGRLLLLHGLMDDNVHPQNTMQLLTALSDARIDAELRIYPPGHHGAAYNQQSSFLILTAEDQYLARYLK